MINRRQNTEVGIVLTLALLVAGWATEAVLWNRIAVVTLSVSILIPVAYTPLSWLWYGFARVAERLFSSLILGLLFFLIVTPVALFRRYFSEDTLHLRCFKKRKDSVFVIKDKCYQAEDLDKQY